MWGLRVNCVKRKELFNLVRLSYKKNRIWQRFEILLLIRVYWYCIPVSAKMNGFSPWFIPFSSWTPWWVVEHWTSEKCITDMAPFSNKKFKRNLNESDSSDNETEAPLPRFIIIESNSAPIIITLHVRKSNINKPNTNYCQKMKKIKLCLSR